MAARFDVVQPTPGEFRWVLTIQGRVLARSDPYTSRASCVRAMESFRAAAPSATIVDLSPRQMRAAATPTTPTAPAAAAAAKVARTTGRVVGKTAARLAEVVERVLPD